MSQSSVIAGALLAAFIFWLAVNNRLQAYTAVLWGATAAPTPTGTPTIAVKNENGSSGSGGGSFFGLPIPGLSGSGANTGNGLGLSDFLDTLDATSPADLATVAAG